MNFPEGIEFQKVETLYSGRFYWIHWVAKCYRINEVDHFLQDQITDLWCYLDKQGMCHHYHRPENKYFASSRLLELLQIPALKQFACQELTEVALSRIAARKTGGNTTEQNTSLRLLQRIVEDFAGQRDTDKGSEFVIQKLKTQYAEEYLSPPDLKT